MKQLTDKQIALVQGILYQASGMQLEVIVQYCEDLVEFRAKQEKQRREK